MKRLGRRSFLRGALGSTGVLLGLPALEAMFNAHGTALADGQPLPKRFVVWFWGNGNEPERWTPTGTGTAWTPQFVQEGLAAIKSDVSLVTGTRLPTRGVNNGHAEGAAGVLAGGDPLLSDLFKGGQDYDFMTVPGPSIDQVVAKQLGATTPFRSIELGATVPHFFGGGPGRVVSFISHTGPYTPNVPVISPLKLFQRLFLSIPKNDPVGDATQALRGSILDLVKADLVALTPKLSTADQRRLADHLDGVRALEQRVRALPAPASSSCKTPGTPVEDPTNPHPSPAVTAKLMNELAAMAFACDLTRVLTYQFSSPGSHDAFDTAPGELACGPTEEDKKLGDKDFHAYVHCVGYNDTTRKVLRYFVDQFAAFVSALKAVPEGSGTLLDASCVLGTSELGDGRSHSHQNFPFLLAGRAGGALRTGLHVSLPGENATRVPFTLLRALGLPNASWGLGERFVTRNPISELLT